MIRRLAAALLFLALSIATFSAIAQTYVISTLGDSITRGWPYFQDFQQGTTTGVYQPALVLSLAGFGLSSVVYNYGYPGDYTSASPSGPGMVNRLGAALGPNPSFLLFMGGINDIASGLISFPTIYSNTAFVMNVARGSGTVPFVATLLPTPNGYAPAASIAAYNSGIPQLAADTGSIWCDHFYVGFPPSYFVDGLHPNTTGYSVIGGRWASCIRTYLNSVVPQSPPVAVNDFSLNNLVGKVVNINIIANDTDSDGAVVRSSVDLNLSAAGFQRAFAVPGKGTLTVNNNGVATFRPVSGFIGSVSIAYRMKDNDGLVSNTGFVIITYKAAIVAPVLNLLLE